MSDLYWIFTLGGLHNFFMACLVISIGMFICFFIITAAADSKGDEDTREKARNITSASFIAVILCTLLTIIIPSKKELYVIYGVGSTIDYLKSNPNAKEIPDKCIKAFEMRADDNISDDNKKKDGDANN